MFPLVLFALIDSTPSPCVNPNREAEVLKTVTLQSSHEYRLASPVTVSVDVAIGPDGAVEGAMIYTSSGDPDIDRVAVLEAKTSTYTPKVVNCKSILSSYIFRAEFSGASSLLKPPFPTFSPRPDWVPMPPESYPNRPYAVWTSNDSTIEITVGPTNKTLAQEHAENIAGLRSSPGVRNIVDREVKTCNGTQTSRLFGYERPGDPNNAAERLGVFTVRHGRRYAVVYVSARPGLPDKAVMNSLLSLCAPLP